MSTAGAALGRAGRTVGDVVDAVLARPRPTFVVLVVVQLVATLALARAATHNGWVWFQGGDQIWFVSDAWAFGHGLMPPANASPGWSLPLIPITWLTGPTFVAAMPLVAVLNLLVLAPLALWCVRDLAGRIGGPLLALWASVCWVAAPFVAIPLFVERYHERWVDQFLPQALGLTAMADFPSMVVCLVVAALVVRSLDTRAWTDAALAGIVLGFAGFMKPPNFMLGAGVALAYVLARRWRDGLIVAASTLPALLALTVYKQRGLGYLPAFALEETRLAAGAFATTIAGTRLDVGRYVDISFEHWRTQMAQLREFLWSARLAQWAPLAGLLAVARLRLPVAGLLGGWLAAFVVVKGWSDRASIEANTFWRLLMPAWPAYLLLAAAIPALVPTLRRRLGARVEPRPARPAGRRVLWATVAALAVAPLALVGLVRPLDGSDDLVLRPEREIVLLTPVLHDFHVTARRQADGTVRLRWQPLDWRGSTVSYRIYRSLIPETAVNCIQSGVTRCTLEADPVADTTGTTWVDRRPGERNGYVVGIAVRYDGGVVGADVFGLSPTVSAPRP